jgi:hypothetical protein
MSSYPPEQVIKVAMQTYFKTHDLGEDGGLNKTWGKIKVGRIYIPILNITARRKALVFHDIHHIVTGYAGDWKGEVSISAWEISSGCGKYWAAWGLDLGGMAVGLFIYTKSVFKAFIRGRRTKNLYRNTISHEAALAMQINELKDKLLLLNDVEQVPTLKERTEFFFYSILALLTVAIPFIILLLIILFLIK